MVKIFTCHVTGIRPFPSRSIDIGAGSLFKSLLACSNFLLAAQDK